MNIDLIILSQRRRHSPKREAVNGTHETFVRIAQIARQSLSVCVPAWGSRGALGKVLVL